MDLVKSPEQIKKIRELAIIISDILAESIDKIKPEMTSRELDYEVECLMKKHKVNGPCKGYEKFPAVSCISINNFITHGIPDDTIIHVGNIVDVDIVIERGGYFADVSKKVGVGQISTEATRLITITEECLDKAISIVQPGITLGDIGYCIQSHAETNGYSVVREYGGHFIGTAMHEGPLVLNYGKPNEGFALKPGMILCIEPMINQGRRGVIMDKYGWNARTRDNKLSSRCEHMVLVTKEGHEVLTRHPETIK
jgi:methionyl aminopeptidase